MECPPSQEDHEDVPFSGERPDRIPKFIHVKGHTKDDQGVVAEDLEVIIGRGGLHSLSRMGDLFRHWVTPELGKGVRLDRIRV